MKVLILGASGIVGQHMRLCVPDCVEPTWVRREADPITAGADQVTTLARWIDPDVIVNLWGNSNVDDVERSGTKYDNVTVPEDLSEWCRNTTRRFIQVSTQAVYQSPRNNMDQPNAYGRQKRAAEISVLANGGIVVRLTFVLGIRPLPHVGRKNPLEAMLEGQSPQVSDRYFSPLFAWDAAELLWDAVLMAKPGEIRQLGEPIRTTRFDIARLVNPDVTACSHDDFEGLAPRAKDTTFRTGSHLRSLGQIHDVIERARMEDRAIELALFFGITLDQAKGKLGEGFGPLHNAVSEDFRRANPQSEAELLNWYRTTEAYIWELSAYHDDPGFNYTGMCAGVIEGIRFAGVEGRPGIPNTSRVLCLGDGIGDLTLALQGAGFSAIYHDLKDSRTAQYAAFRHWRKTGTNLIMAMSEGMADMTWTFGPLYDAICSLDFLEHVPNVDDWVKAAHSALKPGGLFFAVNRFTDTGIEMHLDSNYHWGSDWPALVEAVGFHDLKNGWLMKK